MEGGEFGWEAAAIGRDKAQVKRVHLWFTIHDKTWAPSLVWSLR